MKKIKLIITLIIASLSIISCEEVVSIDLDTAPPKLVIDASIKWQKGTSGQLQKITLTTTTSYYSNTIPVATGGIVTVKNTSLNVPISYQFIEELQTGIYICTNFNPIIGDEYELIVAYNGQTYSSKSVFIQTPKIEKTEQSIVSGFDGKDANQVKFYFQDNGSENNFYLVGAKNSTIAYPEFGVISDNLFQGNLMFATYQSEGLKKDDIITYSVQGITEKYNNYMSKLLNIAGSEGGSPFSTPPATLRGNIINTSNPNEYPFGYFHLAEIDSGIYTIK